MTNYYLPLEPEAYYHIYNRGNNGDNLFYKPANYYYFLHKLDEFVGSYIDVYAYALLPNHFHFLIKTKSCAKVFEIIQQADAPIKGPQNFPHILSEGFRRFFLCYSNSIKKQEGRTGSLFEKNFKRSLISKNEHFFWLVNYIHRNPQTHGLIDDFRKWTFISYASVLSDAPTKLHRKELLALFGGREEFIRFHLTNPVGDSRDLCLE